LRRQLAAGRQRRRSLPIRTGRNSGIRDLAPPTPFGAHTQAMAVDPWWTWLLPLFFGAPWIAAIAWVCLRYPQLWREEPPSMADMMRKRLLDSLK
jgi:hypothetical protein